MSVRVALALAVVLSSVACGVRGTIPSAGSEEAAVAASTLVAASPCDAAWDDRTVFREGLVEKEQAVLDDLPGATVYRMDLEILSDLRVLVGYQEVCYTNRESVPLDEVYFRTYPNIFGGGVTVSDVKVDGQQIEPVYELANSAIRVPQDPPLQPGERVLVEMDFEVQVPDDMGGNYGLFGYFDGVLTLNEFYPVIPVYDDEGWNVEIPSPHADVSYYDASFYLVRVTAPRGLVVVATGVTVGSARKGGNQVITIAAGPARGFYIAASDRYTLASQKVGETTVNVYAFKEGAEGAKLAMEHAVGSLKTFASRFGPYPYTEFDLVSSPMQALGMEYPGTVAISLQLFDLDGEVRGVPVPMMLPGTVVHEVAHQWFYNVVGNDQVDEPWVDEAVVQYATGHHFFDVGGAGAERGYRDSWYERWDRVDRADIPIGLPTEGYSGKEYGAIVYGRGPLFVSALAERMGQETFDEFLRDYYETHKWGIGTGDAFREVAERHCQCDLTSLFQEWVYEK